MQTLNILYVSDHAGETHNSATLSALDPHTMTPKTAQEALAMYTLYFPEVIIFEGHSEMVREVFYHLSSGVTETSPLGMEAMLVIDDGDGKAWQAPANTILRWLPANASSEAVLAAIEALVAARESAYESAYLLEMQADLVA